MKLNRLIEIIILLLNRQRVTANELITRFGVSMRTVYRDIEDLSAAGVPVYMVKGKGGGISLLPEYSINKAVLSESERKNLAVALKTMCAVKYPEMDTLLEKIGALFNNTTDSDWIKFDFSGWNSSPNEQNKFAIIKDAILRCNLISFDYINANGESGSRIVEPEQLYFNRYTWYLTGFCRAKNARRLFRVSRIKNVSAIKEQFQKRTVTDEEIAEQQGYSKPLVDLHLRFSPKTLYRLYDDFDERFITKNNDGGYDVHVTFPEDEWVYGFILSFGNLAEVISPKHIRENVANRLREALKIYEK